MSRIFTAKDGSDLPPYCVEKVLEKVEECYEKARKILNRDFKTCKVEFGVCGTVAGYAHYHEDKIRLNSEFILRQYERMLNRTVPHEIAHLIVYQVFMKGQPYDVRSKIKPHGKEWKLIMVTVFGCDPSRCHNYTMKHVRKKNGNGYRRVPVNPHTKERH